MEGTIKFMLGLMVAQVMLVANGGHKLGSLFMNSQNYILNYAHSIFHYFQHENVYKRSWRICF